MSITEHVDDRHEDGRYTDASNPRMVTYIDPITGYVSHYEILPAVFDEPCTFTITFTQEEPMIPTRRQVWAEIKDRVNAKVIDQHRPFTIAYAWVTNYKRTYYLAYGATRCNHKDEWNPTTGANIAKGRAISNLLDTIMASLKGEV